MFGEHVRIEQHISHITKYPNRLVSSNVQILLREAYEQAYGIYDHRNAKKDHLALVRFHASEDAITYSRLRERLEAFDDLKVGARLHMSFTEFISQPSYVCDLQLEVLATKTNPAEDEIRKALDSIGKEPENK